MEMTLSFICVKSAPERLLQYSVPGSHEGCDHMQVSLDTQVERVGRRDDQQPSSRNSRSPSSFARSFKIDLTFRAYSG